MEFRNGRGLLMSLLLLACMATMTACTIPFTQRIQADLIHGGVSLDEVQFYNSSRFELSRGITSEEAAVSAGVIRVERGQYIEVIVFRAQTPGRCVVCGERDALGVAFEGGEGRRELQFKLAGDAAPPPRRFTGGLAEAIEKTRTAAIDTASRQFWLTGSEVEYAGETYRIDRVRGAVHLRVRRSQVYRLIKEKRVVKGLRVTD